MYEISYQNDEMVIRFERDLVDYDMLAKFPGHMNLQSALKMGEATDATEMIKAL